MHDSHDGRIVQHQGAQLGLLQRDHQESRVVGQGPRRRSDPINCAQDHLPGFIPSHADGQCLKLLSDRFLTFVPGRPCPPAFFRHRLARKRDLPRPFSPEFPDGPYDHAISLHPVGRDLEPLIELDGPLPHDDSIAGPQNEKCRATPKDDAACLILSLRMTRRAITVSA